MERRLINIFEGEFWEEQVKSFCFNPPAKYKKAIGVITSTDTALSLSFQNGTAPKISQFTFFKGQEMYSQPPDKRVLKINEPLDDCVITGVISNKQTIHNPSGDRTLKVFLLVEEHA